MQKLNIKKIVLFFTLIITLATPLIIFYPNLKNLYKGLWDTKIKEKLPKILLKPKENWITIFTHGAFGSLLGFLSAAKVLKDDLKGTSYKKLISRMRKDSFFYCNQPILQKGLVKIKPSFDLSATKNNRLAAYPIIKAYETIQKKIKPNKEQNFFYTFGWSGLMSQNQRRKESIRFYNAITNEVIKFEKDGIKPKIRIVAHSHGGNLSLNLAAVKACINSLENELEKNAITQDEKESLRLMMQRINMLPKKENIKTTKGQKKLDYTPEKKDLVIDEFIMLGTPIQPETENFAIYDLFKKVYNFYSEEDLVQEFDWISTKRYYSRQRLNLNEKSPSKIVQAKIMMERSVVAQKSIGGQDITLTLTTKPFSETQGFWKRLLEKAKSFWKKTNQDPTHRELWFACWNKNNNLAPLPTVILIPLMIKAIEKTSAKTNDLDLNISVTGTDLTLYVLNHNDTTVQNKVSIYKKIIETIKSKIKKWKPKEQTLAKEFDIISKYSNNL